MGIRVLEEGVIAQIAAGEVVARPASVVKELVENALDAGAGQVTVELKGGGVSLIRVTDNGAGIAAGEAELAFARHATSKISRAADLETIQSLGFRGEALPSIAAVAEVTLLTRAAGEDVGTYLALQDGKVVQRSSQARAQGTTVTVHNLFQKVPARRKFLKSLATENSHSASVVSQYALAFPEVRFALLTEGKTVLQTSGRGELLESIIEVYGLKTAQGMLPVAGNGEGWGSREASIKVDGMVGSPSIHHAGRGYLSFFVNRRWVNSRLLTYAVEEAYHGLLMTGRHPVAVLNMTIPPQEIDVNIHPAKSEVKFRDERAVFTAVQRAVRQTLVAQMPVPQVEEVATRYTPTSPPRRELWAGVTLPPAAAQLFPTDTGAALPVLRVLGQVLRSYIVAEGPDGLYLIDQHAAHERIRYETVRRQRAQEKIEAQGLLTPATLEVSPRQEEVLKACSTHLAESGFAIEPFGVRTYLVRTVPALLHNGDWQGMLRELLDSFTGEESGDWAEKVAVSLACHSAVRAGQALSDAEMRELVRGLEEVPEPRTCPHGRPTVIHLSTGKIAREFGRA